MLVAQGTVENRQAIIDIGLQSLVPEVLALTPGAPTLEIPIRTYRALIDTGAQRTCISRVAIAEERLVWHGKKAIQNVHSQNLHHLYWIHLGVWCEAEQGLGAQESHRTYYGLPEPVEVIDIAPSYWFDAIIGMDVLRHYDLSIERTGHFQLRLS